MLKDFISGSLYYSALFSILWVLGFLGAGPASAATSVAPPNYSSFQPPAAGDTYADPAFGTVIKRISNALATPNLDSGGNLIFITDEYSTMTPFNQDNSRILIQHQSYFALYDGNGSYLKSLPFEINASSEPRWSRKDSNVLYYHSGNQLKQYNVATGATSVVRTFSEYSSIEGRGESDISYDGDHFVLVGNGRYVFEYEISTNTKFAAFDTGGRAFDSVYITPNNNVTITWIQTGTARFTGVELFDRNMNFLRQVTHAGGHMDVTLDTDGSEVLVWTNSNDPLPLAGCDNGFVKVKLATAQQTCLLSLDWSLAVHISGTDNSGWVFAETYAPGNPVPGTSAWVPYANEILQIKLDGTQVKRLLHHRSRPYNSYNWNPRVSASRDGSRIVYSSNYGLQGILGYPSEYSDVYLAVLSNGSGSGGGRGSGDVTGSPTPPPPLGTLTTIRTEQNSASAVYSGTWFTTARSFFSGGSAAGAMDVGSRLTLTFTGVGVRIIGYRDEWSGIAKVSLDGAAKGSVDMYASPAGSAVLFSASGLASGPHTVVIDVPGTHSASSQGSWIWVDAFEVDTLAGGTPSPLPTPPTPPPAPVTTRIEQNNSAAAYSGSWFSKSRTFFSGGTAIAAMDANSKVTFTFNGTGVTWIGYKDPWSGMARVYLDGVAVRTIDTYAAADTAKATIYSATGLASGTHKLTIVALQQKRSSSAGYWVWVDAFDVTK